MDRALEYLVQWHFVEVSWSFVEAGPRWLPYSFADGCLHDLVESEAPSPKRDTRWTLAADRI